MTHVNDSEYYVNITSSLHNSFNASFESPYIYTTIRAIDCAQSIGRSVNDSNYDVMDSRQDCNYMESKLLRNSNFL